jgi:hypothetical protein
MAGIREEPGKNLRSEARWAKNPTVKAGDHYPAASVIVAD